MSEFPGVRPWSWPLPAVITPIIFKSNLSDSAVDISVHRKPRFEWSL